MNISWFRENFALKSFLVFFHFRYHIRYISGIFTLKNYGIIRLVNQVQSKYGQISLFFLNSN